MKLTKKDGGRLMWASLGVIALIYLLNPTMGVLELIPDNLPLIGNLDEAGATLLLLKSLIELGVLKRVSVCGR